MTERRTQNQMANMDFLDSMTPVYAGTDFITSDPTNFDATHWAHAPGQHLFMQQQPSSTRSNTDLQFSNSDAFAMNRIHGGGGVINYNLNTGSAAGHLDLSTLETLPHNSTTLLPSVLPLRGMPYLPQQHNQQHFSPSTSVSTVNDERISPPYHQPLDVATPLADEGYLHDEEVSNDGDDDEEDGDGDDDDEGSSTTKLQKSRQSARECRARKKLRYQYLENLVDARKQSVAQLKTEMAQFENYAKHLDEGTIPPGLLELLDGKTAVGTEGSSSGTKDRPTKASDKAKIVAGARSGVRPAHKILRTVVVGADVNAVPANSKRMKGKPRQ